MDRRRRRMLSALGTVSVVTLAGCAGDDEGDGSYTPSVGRSDGESDEDRNTDSPTEDGDESDQQATQPFQQQAKLTAGDGDDEDNFGGAVAIAGDGGTALIGAESDEGPNGEGAGSAYIFTQSESSGEWQQETKLTANDGDDGDAFGEVVAMADDGSTAVIGARHDEDPNGEGAGAAYIFARSVSSWQQEAKLTADDGNRFDQFGHSVAIAGDGSTALIGARYKEDPNGGAAGATYVFSRRSGQWQQEAKLAADAGDTEDEFGYSVAIAGDGTIAIIGARNDEDPNGQGAGSAYVFSRAGSSWQQEAKLTADDGDEADDFGEGVAIAGDGETAIVGADSDEDPNGEESGSAYLFSRSSGSWQQEAKLAAVDGDEEDDFGEVIAMTNDGGTAIIGADSDEDPNGEDAGSAYVFSRAGSNWQQEAKLAADDGDDEDSFGGAVAITGDGSTAIIGADSDEDPNGEGAGSAYVFE